MDIVFSTLDFEFRRSAHFANPLKHGRVTSRYAFALRALSPSLLVFDLRVLRRLICSVLFQPFEGGAICDGRLLVWRSRVAGRTSRHRPDVVR
jgi:hypothetical protein